MSNIGTVKIGTIKKMIDSLQKQCRPEKNVDDIEVTFEYLIASLFPKAYTNMLNLLRDEHTKGYAEGFSSRPNSVEE